MHELSLCSAIADIVSRRASGRGVDVVHVRVGQLRQVVPDSLTFCWTLVTADTTLDGSVIEIERVAARLSCRRCSAEFELGDTIAMACTSCGGLDVAVEAGEEFDVTALDLAEV
jgi:hydrogenase nickel incorporation protein HypA/HybF